MKRCPTCNKTFTDETLSFCLEDGSPLISEPAPVDPNDPEATVVASPDSEVTLVSPPRKAARDEQPRAALQPTISAPQFTTPTPQMYGAAPPQKKSVLPWVLGLGVVGLLLIIGIVVLAIVVPMVLNSSNRSTNNQPAPSPRQTERNATPEKSPSVDNGSDVPTDTEVVSAQLKKLEGDWTEANVKGDKGALERILADDYEGSDSETKREYIDSLEPDSEVQSWDLQGLTVTQKGERATVHGFLIEETKEGTERYEFTDKFVWRDHRWQATGTDTTRVK